jgi:hypothetical protein
MAKLSEEMINKVQEAASRVEYGEITIHLSETMNAVDIVVSERIRVPKRELPRAGQVAVVKIRHSREDGGT